MQCLKPADVIMLMEITLLYSTAVVIMMMEILQLYSAVLRVGGCYHDDGDNSTI